MIPALAMRGRLLVLAGALFVLAGALADAWPLVALGTCAVSAVGTAYLWFFPTAVLLRRRKVEMAWWVPPGDQPGGALTTDHVFSLHVAFRNHGHRRLRLEEIEPFASRAIELPCAEPLIVPAGFEAERVIPLRARSAGHWVLHGVRVRVADALGLFELEAYFPNPLGLKVFPPLAATRVERLLMRPHHGAMHERAGQHVIRLRGMASDLREIRDHTHGDPFKFIAWKATARRQKLMVREFENEIVVTHQLLVDMAGSMRAGAPGRTKLDYAIALATKIARTSLEGGDRVGLVTFDSRVYGQVKPGEGYAHLLRVVDQLLETQNVVDEDLTDLTDGELVSLVSRYLAHQEGVDVRLRLAPPAYDPAWERIVTGPSGELYDIEALTRVSKALLDSHREVQTARHGRLLHATWWNRRYAPSGSHPVLEQLRLFARLRGIELPYRAAHTAGRRAGGLADALSRVTAGERAQLVLVFSDLEGVLEHPEAVQRAIAVARRRHHQVVVVAPFGPAFLEPPASETSRRVADVLSLAERRRLEEARRLLLRYGVPVVTAGPEDTASALARRLSRARGALRQRA